MKTLSLITPVESRQLDKETLRIYEICDGCRRCFNLCPSFNTLLDRIDRYEGDVAKLTPADHHRVVDECYYCKLCFNHCPYTPPHQYELDFPRLMILWKQRLARERGVRWRDRLLIRTDWIGKVGSLTAAVTNRLLGNGTVRRLMETLAGVHRERHVLQFSGETFPRWFNRRRPPASQGAPARKVALFSSCLVNYQATDIGKAAVQVLEKNNVEVVVPEQRCCGMPQFDIGDTQAIQRAAGANVGALHRWVAQGYDVVVPVASCSLMLKREYPELNGDEKTKAVAERTFDICEYLMMLKKDGRLAMDFTNNPGRVAYHMPCHLRDQNIGFKSKELLEAAGAQVDVIEQCSGHDGSWSAKVEFFPLSMKIAAKAVRTIEQNPADLVASDCPLAGLQLDQAGASTHVGGKATLHPIQIIRDAYGLPARVTSESDR
ncbi:heterodisulfide reductase-related iron-sulfur binding cluster [Nitrospira moscoviensis]|uniref:Putative Fe-S oxidoreductase n=1 Tax=Nitrospira moscoviensis TaxID=42253 RepID=A0A0K2GIF4_NITMO|nr:heterodisulfide reductase-related iron-sulfur binding cluster [Nitrospira moscoviensis]ALA60716.1 putative Fe-S oxidoreductase [Nitrospira moscoviensis]